MDTDTVTLFLALLAVIAQVSVVVSVAVAIAGRFAPGVRRIGAWARAQVGPEAVALGAVVALVCTSGSLYLSEVAHYPPCRLCWYQRFAMYPLVPVLAVAAATRSRRVRVVAALLGVVGAGISVFHILVERYPTLAGTSCDRANPCSIIWVERFGYLTIPTMALSGFALVLTLLAWASPAARTVPQEAP